MRRSMLFLPGNTPNMLINGSCLGADAVIFDLEDAVSPDDQLIDVTMQENGSGTLHFASGVTMAFSAARDMTATAYTAGHDGVGTRTATGTTVRKGVVAVDRKVIPLGTKMFIVANGGIVYGSAVAEDTGIRGNKVDLYHDTYNECIQFGRRGCTVYILE